MTSYTYEATFCRTTPVCILRCQVYFYRGVLCEFGANVGRLCLCLLATSAGMFISSTAFLPSTTSMYLTLLSMGAWFQHQYKLAIFCTAFSTFMSEFLYCGVRNAEYIYFILQAGHLQRS